MEKQHLELFPYDDTNEYILGKYAIKLTKNDHFDSNGRLINDEVISGLNSYLMNLNTDEFDLLFRSVDKSRLPSVLNNGVDVLPTTDTIYCTAWPSKVLEYIKFDSVIQIFDSSKLNPTWKILNKSTPKEEIQMLKLTYPFEFEINDEIMLSRFNRNNNQRFSMSEISYCFWIPDNPQDALLGLLIINT